MTTHFSWGTTLIRLLCCLAVLLMISSAALAQPAVGTVTRLVLKSEVLGEERTSVPVYKANYERVHAKLKETKKQ